MNFEKLIIASHNAGKIREYKKLFHPFEITVTSAGDLNLPEPEETGSTFQENAYLKAYSIATLTQTAAMGDDGGLVIPALGGHPGIYSARWAKAVGGFKNAYVKLAEMLKNKSPEAYFQIVVALYNPKTQESQYFEGKCLGKLAFPAAGDQGFGYDAIFVPEGYNNTFAELGSEVKNKISHRAHAFSALIKEIFKS